MKTLRIAAALAAIITLAAACEKEGTEIYRGNYSFKTSGYVTATRDSSCRFDTTYNRSFVTDTAGNVQVVVDTVITEMPDTVSMSLTTESGQMDIIETDAKDGKMALTMNVTGGDMVIFYAEMDGDDIVLDTLSRKMKLYANETDLVNPKEATFNITGRGTKYDNIIIFNLDYSGYWYDSSVRYDVTSSSVVCRAKLNE